MQASSTVDRAIDVLFHLHAQERACGVSELGRALGMPRSSVHRLLTTLAHRGLLERVERGHYRPGLGLMVLGLGALDRQPVAVAARPVLEEQVARFGETVFLTVAHRGQIRVLDKAEGSGFLRAAPQVGSEVPVHATAVGKLWLAFAPQEVAPASEPPIFTERTLRGGAALRAAVEQAHRQGFAENHGEWIAGLSVVAAPILQRRRGDAEPGLEGALALAAPTARLVALGPAQVGRSLKAAATRVALCLVRPGARNAAFRREAQG